MSGLSNDAAVVEDLIKAASQKDGFLAVLDQGREALITLQQNIRAIQKAIAKLDVINSIPFQQAQQTSVNAAVGLGQTQGVSLPAQGGWGTAASGSSNQAMGVQQMMYPPPPMNSIPLPKLPLQQFGGDPKDWPSFWDWFADAVDSQSIPDVQKLTYLRSCLTGSAQNTVAAFSMRNKNYSVVLKSLHDKYGDKMVITHSLYDELESLPKVSEDNLRRFVESLERILELLRHQGEDVNSLVVQRMIERKLPK